MRFRVWSPESGDGDGLGFGMPFCMRDGAASLFLGYGVVNEENRRENGICSYRIVDSCSCEEVGFSLDVRRSEFL